MWHLEAGRTRRGAAAAIWSLPLLCAALLTGLTGCKKGVILEGKVVDTKTQKPIPGVTVDIAFERLDANMNWIDGGRTQVISGPSGEFTARHPDMRAHYVVLGRHKGYYPNYDCKPMNKVESRIMAFIHHVRIQMFPIIDPQPLPRGPAGEVRFLPPGRRMGWNLAQASMVPESQADFWCELDEVGNDVAFLVARGQGGFTHASWLNGEYAIYNMPYAPENGYVQRFDLREVKRDARSCFYVRAADGVHYGKIDITGRTRARSYMGLRFQWVYQPDGSHALEIPLPESNK